MGSCASSLLPPRSLSQPLCLCLGALQRPPPCPPLLGAFPFQLPTRSLEVGFQAWLQGSQSLGTERVPMAADCCSTERAQPLRLFSPASMLLKASLPLTVGTGGPNPNLSEWLPQACARGGGLCAVEYDLVRGVRSCSAGSLGC